MTLLETIRADIATKGPMPFEEFMARCLYDPAGGFFATGPLRSVKAGDFLTSPEVSPWFGRMIGRWAEGVQARIGRPFTVVEAGAGSGSLLDALIGELAPGPDAAWAVEASPAAAEALAERLPDVRLAGDIAEVPPLRGVLVANELLDNLPVALAVKTETGWEERWVGAGGDTLELVSTPGRPDVVAWADRYGGKLATGSMVEVQLEAGNWLRRALGRVETGAALLIDYGGTTEELEPRRTRGTLRTYRAHHLGPDPLTEPGETDVTVDVHFGALIDAAVDLGWEATLHRQDDFLAALGLRDVITDVRRREREAARDGDAMTRLRLRSEATDAETLLHPRGLGDFRVLEVWKKSG